MAGNKSTIGALLDETGGSIKTGPFGTKLKAAEYTATGVPVISVGEVGFGRLRIHHDTPRVDETVTSRMPEFLLKAGDIVFGRKGAVERSAQIQPHEDGYFLGSDGIRIRLNFGTCDPRFISYQLQTMAHRSWMIQHAAGTTMPSLNEGIIRRIPIILKPFAEQNAIAAVLGALDDKIELIRRMNSTLEAMARALFQSWFVDFDPVRAKLDGRAPVGLDPATAALFPATFQESARGPIPHGWDARPVAELADVVKGRSYRSEELAESKTALVTLKSFLRGGGYRADGLKPFTGNYKPNQRVRAGDLVVALTDVTQTADVIGKPALVRSDDRFETLVASLDVGIVKPKSQNASLPFLYCLFMTEEFKAHTYSHATGTTVLHLGSSVILSFVSIVPPAIVAEKFAERADPIFRLIDENARQSRILANLRDTLLPRLLNGDVQVLIERHPT